MSLFNLRHMLVATVLMVFLGLPSRGVDAILERRQDPAPFDAHCAPGHSDIQARDCEVAVLNLPFTEKRGVLVTGGTYVVSAFKTCRVIVSCATQTQTTSMALLSNNYQGGGFNLLDTKCGPNGLAGRIFFDQDCSIRATSPPV
ncbi:hypothetical protein MJO28_002819 [Puccinia striiformis f. sp. tritici]|uniref:Uncharacterized protein n=3 Tax=Puccinia striiformis TaxID=27350 RepID=A0A0L0VK17_9BASI|nr:hypothetical protein Pst134EA_005219 [Puccinia striiformis f. sp. tritici]KNE99622.1 hypothetical protein PSTG_07115 [Puccinia striiformis f. sp. tritici PST-78]POW01054.1 hypothetical protein PSTT_12773 [Puccinia striiformis]KAH9462406.1 hypothetical protein Pst134EB_006299 [Puccinia striiformis f. sp. tritici]KAH9471319.1 hypothetical protein Pst134EA_005219 [Puccinia striiformis f. sp. tritici]KAI7959028.1 hypothetical protein MJO28_002819 [Puccinia striiformis f. sp. tritici]